MKKYQVGIIGATGMVGQRLITLLHNHPWFDIALLAASRSSAGKTYEEAVRGRWMMKAPLPETVQAMMVCDAAEAETIAKAVDFIFCAVSLPKDETRAMEEGFARLGIPVVSNNSACRLVDDVPMIIPEINAEHAQMIKAQQQRLGTDRGFIVVKPNCSIQSYVPALHALMEFHPIALNVCTYQAVSGAGRTLANWPEMLGNVIPYIGGEEEKSEQEPSKVWGQLSADKDAVIGSHFPRISAQCLRVPVEDGHLAAVSVAFENPPTRAEILERWTHFHTLPQALKLPSAPDPFLIYLEEDNRPQPTLDAEAGHGMAITIGRLREDPLMDWRFVCLSHNTLRGAAGGSVLTAELLCAQGYITHRDKGENT
ncbi:MAG: aspartate-semialdehyde dehydrogenase [Clostridiales bacterium]|nr:aspartate-semialdehyde dehydrogenase [Clostridiales bacterium]